MKSYVLACSTAAVALAALGLPVHAQQIFRSVGPDGRITFSDKPPVSGSEPTATANAASGPQLPFELRQAVTRYPVTIYTGNGCAPCANGRALLTNRGVPFTERIVSSPEDIEALQRLSGETGLPLLTVGTQQLKGFAESEWVQFLNAAGYPRTSQLPPSYRNPQPTPLVARAEAAAPSPSTQDNVRPLAPLQAPASNPAGIRF